MGKKRKRSRKPPNEYLDINVEKAVHFPGWIVSSLVDQGEGPDGPTGEFDTKREAMAWAKARAREWVNWEDVEKACVLDDGDEVAFYGD